VGIDFTAYQGRYRIIYSEETHLYRGSCKIHGSLFAGIAVRKDAHDLMATHIVDLHNNEPIFRAAD